MPNMEVRCLVQHAYQRKSKRHLNRGRSPQQWMRQIKVPAILFLKRGRERERDIEMLLVRPNKRQGSKVLAHALAESCHILQKTQPNIPNLTYVMASNRSLVFTPSVVRSDPWRPLSGPQSGPVRVAFATAAGKLQLVDVSSKTPSIILFQMIVNAIFILPFLLQMLFLTAFVSCGMN